MNFLQEIKKCVDMGQSNFTLSSRGGYVCGVKRVCEISENRICLECGEGAVAVRGSKLKLTKLADGDAAFSGEIEGIDFL